MSEKLEQLQRIINTKKPGDIAQWYANHNAKCKAKGLHRHTKQSLIDQGAAGNYPRGWPCDLKMSEANK